MQDRLFEQVSVRVGSCLKQTVVLVDGCTGGEMEGVLVQWAVVRGAVVHTP